MTYDQYKLATDRDNCTDMVTSCCGADEVGSGASNCCDSKFWGHTDICGECKEHADEYMICSECDEDDSTYEMIEQYEYEQNQKDFYTDL
jgi:hypothetical protein